MATKTEAVPSSDAIDLLVTRKVGSQYRRGSNLKKATQTANEQHRIKMENDRLSQRLATIDKRKAKPAATDATTRVKELRRETNEKRKKMVLKKLDKENDIMRDRLKKVKPVFTMQKDPKAAAKPAANRKDQKESTGADAANDAESEPQQEQPSGDAAAAAAEDGEEAEGNDEYEDDQNEMDAPDQVEENPVA